MSKLEELGRHAVVRQVNEQVTLSFNHFDLIFRAADQLGRFFMAHSAVEAGVLDFDLHNSAVMELRAALLAIDPDVLELIGWQAQAEAEKPK